MSDRRIVNEYLFYEFGYDLHQDPSAVADDWPFELRMVGMIHSAQGKIEVLEFVADDNEVHFALSGSTLTSYPSAGMTLKELQLQQDGATWIAYRDPIDVATSRLGDDSVPSATERRTSIEELAANACASPRILEGLYLCKARTYLALIEDASTGIGMVVGSGLEPYSVGFPEASAWRRLALGVGEMLKRDILK